MLLAVVVIVASNPAITFAVVPDRVVGVGSSITVDEGDIVEINCSDLKHAGIYSLSEYDHDISKQMEKIASAGSSAFSNYDAAIAQIAARGETDQSLSAGLEKAKGVCSHGTSQERSNAADQDVFPDVFQPVRQCAERAGDARMVGHIL